ncbi:hypothetical protein BN1723_012245 [Verticillium longisporum]|uniref:DUF7580 domain-containing protein n=1 Tax=Verticillium longisporum TaxID=100787 RepID=A0A0G4LB15_VERLO|nr:hypothetical protein BN1708_003213 [Verticillium longisporum]CRK21049.1 hypothetical protein BN1723_012245 [Verticillium longisporum]
MTELAIGIVPLVGLVITSYKAVARNLKTYRHYSKKLKRFQVALSVQRSVFENECHLLLRLVLPNDDAIDEMIADPDHERWADPGLDDAIAQWLGKSLEAYKGSVEASHEALCELEEQLRGFNVVHGLQQKGERMKDTLRRLRRVQDGVKVVINEKNYISALDELKQSTEGLTALREQIAELDKLKTAVQIKTKRPPAGEWARLLRIRRASKALHDALAGAWNCSQEGHMRHLVKLFIETDLVDDEIQMDIAIVCHTQVRNTLYATLVELEVRSQNLEWIESRQIPAMMPPADGEIQRPSKRLKTVKVTETTVTSSSPCLGSAKGAFRRSKKATCRSSCDLRASKDVCMELTSKSPPASGQDSSACLGHLDIESEAGYRHSFYPGFQQSICRKANRDPVPISQVFEPTAAEYVTMLDRLKLARSLVSAVLKFHSTPWLRDMWQLQDLSIFPTDNDDLTRSLNTLHVGVGFARRNAQRQAPESMEGVLCPEDLASGQMGEHEESLCSIDNKALFSLGVALLQIDRWVRLNVETPDDVVDIRKLSRRRFALGPQYGKITQKCLRCDFGHGDDLSKPRLQEAVYGSLVGVLEKMISSLDLNDDEDES